MGSGGKFTSWRWFGKPWQSGEPTPSASWSCCSALNYSPEFSRASSCAICSGSTQTRSRSISLCCAGLGASRVRNGHGNFNFAGIAAEREVGVLGGTLFLPTPRGAYPNRPQSGIYLGMAQLRSVRSAAAIVPFLGICVAAGEAQAQAVGSTVFSGVPIPPTVFQRPIPMPEPGGPIGTPVPTMPAPPLARDTPPAPGEDDRSNSQGAAQASDDQPNGSLDDKALDGIR